MNFRGRIEIKDGHWWGLVDHSEGISTWAPLGSLSTVGTGEVLGCFRLARWYWGAGILGEITGPIIREDGKDVVEVIRGTHRGNLDGYRPELVRA